MILDRPKKVTIGLTAVLGTVLILSYVPLIRMHTSGLFDFWLGMPKSAVTNFYIFMLVAAIGFGLVLFDYLLHPHKETGIFKETYVFPLLIGIILVFSIVWSVCVVQYAKSSSLDSSAGKGWAGISSASLVVVALCSLLVIAGNSEASQVNYGLVGAVMFCITTVLVDSVGWNARFIRQVFEQTK